MNYKKVTRPKFWAPVDIGDSVEGEIVGRGSIKTVYGDLEHITLLTAEGEKINIGMQSSLRPYSILLIDGITIKIVYNGECVNVKTKRTFKSYDLYIGEEE